MNTGIPIGIAMAECHLAVDAHQARFKINGRYDEAYNHVIDLLKALAYAQGLGATHADFTTHDLELISFR